MRQRKASQKSAEVGAVRLCVRTYPLSAKRGNAGASHLRRIHVQHVGDRGHQHPGTGFSPRHLAARGRSIGAIRAISLREADPEIEAGRRAPTGRSDLAPTTAADARELT